MLRSFSSGLEECYRGWLVAGVRGRTMAERIKLPKAAWRAFIVVLVIIIAICVVLTSMPKPKHNKLSVVSHKKVKRGRHTILVWPQNAPMREAYGTRAFQTCPVFKNCEFTHNRARLNESKVVYFLSPRLRPQAKDMPPHRVPDQIWALHSLEPAYLQRPVQEQFDGAFNLMINDRPDADIRYGNGYVKPVLDPIQIKNYETT